MSSDIISRTPPSIGSTSSTHSRILKEMREPRAERIASKRIGLAQPKQFFFDRAQIMKPSHYIEGCHASIWRMTS